MQFSYPDYQPAFVTDPGRSRREKAQEIVEPLAQRVDQAVRLRGQPTAGPAVAAITRFAVPAARPLVARCQCEMRLVDDLRAVVS